MERGLNLDFGMHLKPFKQQQIGRQIKTNVQNVFNPDALDGN
jgi:hypothetical protein